MPYATPEPWTLTLDAVGCPELFLKLREPRDLPAGRRREYARAQMTLAQLRSASLAAEAGQAIVGRLPDADQAREAISKFDQLLVELLEEWNLPFPQNWPDKKLRGKVIPLDYQNPEGEADPAYPVPGPVYDAIVAAILERVNRPPKSPS